MTLLWITIHFVIHFMTHLESHFTVWFTSRFTLNCNSLHNSLRNSLWIAIHFTTHIEPQFTSWLTLNCNSLCDSLCAIHFEWPKVCANVGNLKTGPLITFRCPADTNDNEMFLSPLLVMLQHLGVLGWAAHHEIAVSVGLYEFGLQWWTLCVLGYCILQEKTRFSLILIKIFQKYKTKSTKLTGKCWPEKMF